MMSFLPIILDSLTSDPAWLLEQEGFDPNRERDLEALFTVGNGYFGARGSLSVPIPVSETDSFIAGIYDQKRPSTPYSELEFLESEQLDETSDPYRELVSFPSPFELEISSNGESLTPENARNEDFLRRLDLRNACLLEQLKWLISAGRELAFRSARTAFLNDRGFLLQELSFQAMGKMIPIKIYMKTLGSDFATIHTHLQKIALESQNFRGSRRSTAVQLLRTKKSGFFVAIGSKAWRDGAEVSAEALQWNLEPPIPSVVQRVWLVRTSRDCAEPAQAVTSTLDALTLDEVRERFARHQETWGRFWAVADIRFLDSPEVTDAQRFSIFHLRAAASSNPKAGIGARALSGRAYEGHVFWDSEIFIFPFLLHVDLALARNLLAYRYQTLEGARRRAKKMGCQGACYAWESTVTGDDVTPERLLLKSSGKTVPIFTGAQQIHVTADVAFAISKYAQVTGDDEWVCNEGMEILVETARFWASRVTPREGRFHILKVVGPDEYHHDVDDNAFTNWMARFNLQVAAEISERVKKKDPLKWNELSTRLHLKAEELLYWVWLAPRIYFPEPTEDGVIEQFTGYFKRKTVPLPHRQEIKAPIERLFSWEKVNEEQIIKQADVLMIPFLFPQAFTKETVLANFLYYEPRTDHASSLSPGVHAGVAALVDLWEDALRFWRMGLNFDLSNLMGNTSLGLHLGNMGATWQALVFYILGLPHSQGHGGAVREKFLKTFGPVELFSGRERVVYENHGKSGGSG